MQEFLTQKLSAAFKKLQGKDRITKEQISEVIDEIRASLLEADVNYHVVEDFIQEVSEKAVGSKVNIHVSPEQQLIKVVHDQLVDLMGKSHQGIQEASHGPTMLMMAGIQGSGKTTFCGKLARHLSDKKKKVLLVACDLQRPAAIIQLKQLAEQIGCDVYYDTAEKDPLKVASQSLEWIQNNPYDYIIYDTAGRMQVDEELMDELGKLRTKIKPHEIFFVLDAMMGQSALEIAKRFHDVVAFDSVVINKFDGDARGGVALSVRYVLGKPIKFIGIGEKMTDFEIFHPDRIASRILGMGDIVSLVEKAETVVSKKESKKLEEKIKKDGLDLQDFLQSIRQIKKMGPLKNMLRMIPGMSDVLANNSFDDSKIVSVEAMICSMTPEERKNPDIIESSHSRQKRITQGSGCNFSDLNHLLQHFAVTSKMMKKFSKTKDSNFDIQDLKDISLKDIKQMQNQLGHLPNQQGKKKKKKKKSFFPKLPF